MAFAASLRTDRSNSCTNTEDTGATNEPKLQIYKWGYGPRLEGPKNERLSAIATARAKAAMIDTAAATRMKFRAPAANAGQSALAWRPLLNL